MHDDLRIHADLLTNSQFGLLLKVFSTAADELRSAKSMYISCSLSGLMAQGSCTQSGKNIAF